MKKHFARIAMLAMTIVAMLTVVASACSNTYGETQIPESLRR